MLTRPQAVPPFDLHDATPEALGGSLGGGHGSGVRRPGLTVRKRPKHSFCLGFVLELRSESDFTAAQACDIRNLASFRRQSTVES